MPTSFNGRQLIAEGIDPSQKRKAEKLASADTFRAIGDEWLALQKDKLASPTFDKAKRMLELRLSTSRRPADHQGYGA